MSLPDLGEQMLNTLQSILDTALHQLLDGTVGKLRGSRRRRGVVGHSNVKKKKKSHACQSGVLNHEIPSGWAHVALWHRFSIRQFSQQRLRRGYWSTRQWWPTRKMHSPRDVQVPLKRGCSFPRLTVQRDDLHEKVRWRVTFVVESKETKVTCFHRTFPEYFALWGRIVVSKLNRLDRANARKEPSSCQIQHFNRALCKKQSKRSFGDPWKLNDYFQATGNYRN